MKRGKRLELSEAEARLMLDLASKRLVKQIKTQTIDEALVNVVRKLTKLSANSSGQNQAKGE